MERKLDPNKKLSRREFLKALVLTGKALVLSGCVPPPGSTGPTEPTPASDGKGPEIEVTDTPVNTVTQEPGKEPTPTPQTFTGSIYELEGDVQSSLADEFKENVQDEPRDPTFFNIVVNEDSVFTFAAVSELVGISGETLLNERLFLRVQDDEGVFRWKELSREIPSGGEQDIVVWSYSSDGEKDGEKEPVLWLSGSTSKVPKPEEGEEMSYLVFAPPAELESMIPGFTREDGKGIVLSETPNKEGERVFPPEAKNASDYFQDIEGIEEIVYSQDIQSFIALRKAPEVSQGDNAFSIKNAAGEYIWLDEKEVWVRKPQTPEILIPFKIYSFDDKEVKDTPPSYFKGDYLYVWSDKDKNWIVIPTNIGEGDFEFNQERDYRVENIDGTLYLVDQYTTGRMAKYDTESGKWIKTDLEERYGHMVEGGIYINKEMFYMRLIWPDVHTQNLRTKVIFTGNYKEEDVSMREKEYKVYFFETLMRDGSGEIVRFWVPVGSNTLDPSSAINISYPNPKDNSRRYSNKIYRSDADTVAGIIPPGTELDLIFVYKILECSNLINIRHASELKLENIERKPREIIYSDKTIKIGDNVYLLLQIYYNNKSVVEEFVNKITEGKDPGLNDLVVYRRALIWSFNDYFEIPEEIRENLE